MCVVISQEKTARELLSIEDINQAIVAYEIQKIVKDDKKVTSSTLCFDIYNVFNIHCL
jgi:hypothetical protein